jgi:hypothetical protein
MSCIHRTFPARKDYLDEVEVSRFVEKAVRATASIDELEQRLNDLRVQIKDAKVDW